MSLITGKSRVMIFNYQNNPPGALLSCDEMVTLAQTNVERDLIVIADNGAKHRRMASSLGMRIRMLVVDSFP